LICSSLAFNLIEASCEGSKGSKYSASFIQDWYCSEWTLDIWEQHFSAAKAAGLSALIIQSTLDIRRGDLAPGYSKQDMHGYPSPTAFCMYPTTVYNGASLPSLNGGDALALILTAAKNTNMKLWIGTISDDMWWNYGWGLPETDHYTEWSEDNSQLNVALITEMWNRYKTNFTEQIAGWYYHTEIWNIDIACAGTDTDKIYAKTIGKNINATVYAAQTNTPGKPVLISPFWNPDVSTSQGFTSFLNDLMDNVDFRPIDLYAPQDGGGAERSTELIREWALAQKTAVDREGLRFGINSENFNVNSSSKQVSELIKDYNAVADLAEDFIIFSWDHYYAVDDELNSQFTEFNKESLSSDSKCSDSNQESSSSGSKDINNQIRSRPCHMFLYCIMLFIAFLKL